MKIKKLDNSYYGLRMSDGGAIYIGGFIIYYLLSVVILLIGIATGDDNFMKLPWVQYMTMFLIQIGFFATPFIYGKLMDKPMLKESRIKRGLNLKQTIVLVALGLACIVAFLPFANGFVEILKLTGYKGNATNYPPTDSWWTLILSLVLVAIVPAICEEFLFRGAIARAFKTKNYIFAVLVSASLFAIFHGSAAQLVHQFLIGGVFAIVYFVTGSLWSSILVHFVNNATVLLIQYFFGSVLELNIPLWGVWLVNIAMALIGILIVYALLRLLIKLSRKGSVKAGKSSFFIDLGRAFYPQGIVQNTHKLNATLKSMYADDVDSMPLEPDVSAVANVEDLGLKAMLIQNNILMQGKRRKYDILSVVLAFAVALAPWIINFIAAY